MSKQKQSFQKIVDSIKEINSSLFSNIVALEDAMFYSLMDLFLLFREEGTEPSEQKACLRLVLTTFYDTTPPEQHFLLDSGVERSYILLTKKGQLIDAAQLDRIRQGIKTSKQKQISNSFN